LEIAVLRLCGSGTEFADAIFEAAFERTSAHASGGSGGDRMPECERLFDTVHAVGRAVS
jgi:hypothetical protein